MTLRTHRTNSAKNPHSWQHGEESQPYYRIGYKPGSREVRIGARDHLIEIGCELPKLRAYSANQDITPWRKLAKEERGAVLDSPVRLRERREDNVPFLHPLYSGLDSFTRSSGKSGSASP